MCALVRTTFSERKREKKKEERENEQMINNLKGKRGKKKERSVVNKMSAYIEKKENVHRRVFIKKYV